MVKSWSCYIWSYFIESSKGPWRWWRDWSICPVKKGWELGLFSSRDILSIYFSIWRQSVKKVERVPFQCCLVTGQEPIEANWNTGSSIWPLENTLFTLRLTKPWHRLHRGCGVSLFEDLQRPPGCGPGHPALDFPVWAGVGQMTSRGLFHRQLVYDSMAHWFWQCNADLLQCCCGHTTPSSSAIHIYSRSEKCNLQFLKEKCFMIYKFMIFKKISQELDTSLRWLFRSS